MEIRFDYLRRARPSSVRINALPDVTVHLANQQSFYHNVTFGASSSSVGVVHGHPIAPPLRPNRERIDDICGNDVRAARLSPSPPTMRESGAGGNLGF